jgi:hypothetical protein
MEEIAGLDTYRLRWVYSRARGDDGKLIRRAGDLPEWCEVDSRGFRIVKNPQPFVKMFAQVCLQTWNMNREQMVATWEDFKQDNPDFERKGNY